MSPADFTQSDIRAAQEAFNDLGVSASLAERLEKLKEIRDMANLVANDYDEISSRFGNTGPHAYRAADLRDWVEDLNAAVMTIQRAVEAMQGVDRALQVANKRPKLWS